MTREDARYYLRSSGFSEEQINTIEQAFKQEPCVGSTQKSVENALEMRCDDAVSRELEIKKLKEQPAKVYIDKTDYQRGYIDGVNQMVKELKAEQEPCTDAQERYEDLCEYFGDAKDILKSRKDFKAWLERVKWHIHKAEELYEKSEMIFNNLCSSCTNIGCEFQYGIVRTKCAFYMPPHIEPDNCGNYVVMQLTDDAISREAVLDIIRFEDKWLLDAKGHNADTEIAFSGMKARIAELPPVTQKPDNKYRKEAKRWKNKWLRLKSQKSGKWIIDRSVLPYTYTCNICGRNVFDDYDYCPFCGCAMKQERSEE